MLMDSEVSILISSAGRRNQLLHCFRESAKKLGILLRIVCVDTKPALSAACADADTAHAVSRCNSPEFIEQIRAICTREDVRLIVPTIDPELEVYCEHCESLERLGAVVSVSSRQAVAIARDKLATTEFLASLGVKVPRSVSATDYIAAPEKIEGPVIIKPRGGSSSVGIVRPNSVAEAVTVCRQMSNALVQELWIGREYTVNLYVDRRGRLRCAIPHVRIETRGGEVSKGRTEDIPVLREVARKIASRLPGVRGALCFQAIVTESGDYVVFEINARFGGGYPLAHRAGATFTQWLLEETLGLPCTAEDEWRAGVTMLRFDDAVFIDP